MWIEFIGAETGYRKIEKLESLTYYIQGIYINRYLVNTRNQSELYNSIRNALIEGRTIFRLEDISREDMNKVLGGTINV